MVGQGVLATWRDTNTVTDRLATRGDLSLVQVPVLNPRSPFSRPGNVTSDRNQLRLIMDARLIHESLYQGHDAPPIRCPYRPSNRQERILSFRSSKHTARLRSRCPASSHRLRARWPHARGIEMALKKRGYPSIEDLKAGKK
jgi:hypothetical protein